MFCRVHVKVSDGFTWVKYWIVEGFDLDFGTEFFDSISGPICSSEFYFVRESRGALGSTRIYVTI